MVVLLAALELLIGALQQHVKHAPNRASIPTLERGVTDDEHSAALKLLEVNACSCIYLRAMS